MHHQEKTSVYFALVADIRSSRKRAREERRELQYRLRSTLKELSNEHRDDLTIPFQFTLGDECEALLHHPRAIPAILWKLETRFDIRIAIGRGEIYTDTSAPIGEVDGPAFHRARDAIESADKRRPGAVFRGFAPEIDAALSALARTLGTIRSRWTDRQREVAQKLRTGLNVTEIARSAAQSPQNISSLKQKADWALHTEVEQAISLILNSGEHTALENQR